MNLTLPKQVLNQDGKILETFDPRVKKQLSVSDENLKVVREGMHLAVNDPWGSAFPLRDLKSDPSAKTGSAEALRKVNGVF